MDPEATAPSEVCESPRGGCGVTPLTEGRMADTRAGEGRGRVHRGQHFGVGKLKVLETEGGGGCPAT